MNTVSPYLHKLTFLSSWSWTLNNEDEVVFADFIGETSEESRFIRTYKPSGSLCFLILILKCRTRVSALALYKAAISVRSQVNCLSLANLDSSWQGRKRKIKCGMKWNFYLGRNLFPDLFHQVTGLIHVHPVSCEERATSAERSTEATLSWSRIRRRMYTANVLSAVQTNLLLKLWTTCFIAWRF